MSQSSSSVIGDHIERQCRTEGGRHRCPVTSVDAPGVAAALSLNDAFSGVSSVAVTLRPDCKVLATELDLPSLGDEKPSSLKKQHCDEELEAKLSRSPENATETPLLPASPHTLPVRPASRDVHGTGGASRRTLHLGIQRGAGGGRIVEQQDESAADSLASRGVSRAPLSHSEPPCQPEVWAGDWSLAIEEASLQEWGTGDGNDQEGSRPTADFNPYYVAATAGTTSVKPIRGVTWAPSIRIAGSPRVPALARPRSPPEPDDDEMALEADRASFISARRGCKSTSAFPQASAPDGSQLLPQLAAVA